MGYCSLVTFREVFCKQSSQKTREAQREIMRMHNFCASAVIHTRRIRLEVFLYPSYLFILYGCL